MQDEEYTEMLDLQLRQVTGLLRETLQELGELNEEMEALRAVKLPKVYDYMIDELHGTPLLSSLTPGIPWEWTSLAEKFVQILNTERDYERQTREATRKSRD